MEKVKPTRSELLKVRKRIKLAKKGHELLKKKQDSLIIEFFAILKDMRADHDKMQSHYVRAETLMNQARALESDVRISAASLAAQKEEPIQLEIKNVAGVRIPQITRVQAERTAPLFRSIMIQDLALAYGQVVDDIIAIAARETTLRKLLDEIKKTKRRAHALEQIFIPRLEATRKAITFDLEERSREEFTRLKRRKK